MKTLVVVFVLALSIGVSFLAQDSEQSKAELTNVAGKWQLSWKGVMWQTRRGTLQIRQDGSKLSGEFVGDKSFPLSGSFPIAGTVEGNKVSFSFEPMAGMKIGFTGTVEDQKMSGKTSYDKSWTASR
jgi:hypothetical protein